MTAMTFSHLLSFFKEYIFHLLQVPTHGLSTGCRITPLDGSKDLLMALKGFLFSFLRLKVPLTGLSQEGRKGQAEDVPKPCFLPSGPDNDENRNRFESGSSRGRLPFLVL